MTVAHLSGTGARRAGPASDEVRHAGRNAAEEVQKECQSPTGPSVPQVRLHPMVPFVVVGAVGLAVLLVSLAFGDMLDLLDGALTGAGLGAGMAVFGAVGAIVTVNDGPLVLTYVLSAVFGLAVLAGVPALVRMLGRSDDGTPHSPLGLYGTARSTITVASGEVSLDGPHEMETRMAFSDYQIASGTRVHVVDVQGTRVKVELAGPADAPSDPAEPPR